MVTQLTIYLACGILKKCSNFQAIVVNPVVTLVPIKREFIAFRDHIFFRRVPPLCIAQVRTWSICSIGTYMYYSRCLVYWPFCCHLTSWEQQQLFPFLTLSLRYPFQDLWRISTIHSRVRLLGWIIRQLNPNLSPCLLVACVMRATAPISRGELDAVPIRRSPRCTESVQPGANAGYRPNLQWRIQTLR